MKYVILLFLFLLTTIGYGFSQDSAEKDNEFDHGSKITHIDSNPATIENLKILGLVWGFVKYYHPNVASGQKK